MQNNQIAQIIYYIGTDTYIGSINISNQKIMLSKLNLNISATHPILFVLKNKAIFVAEPNLKNDNMIITINNQNYRLSLDRMGHASIDLTSILIDK